MPDRALLALAVYTTLAAPFREDHARLIVAAKVALANPERVLEVAGVVFAFNAVNRIADARRVLLEYRWLRELKPIRGWVERGFASLTKLFYDLSEIPHPRYTCHESLRGLETLFRQRGSPDVPEALRLLGPAPRVLEGILEILASSCTLCIACQHTDELARLVRGDGVTDLLDDAAVLVPHRRRLVDRVCAPVGPQVGHTRRWP
jgi:hypothetical protein